MFFHFKLSCYFLFFILISCSSSENKKSKKKKQDYHLASESKLSFESTPENFKVAFIGDTEKGLGFERVLKLIKNEKAEMVIHMGDFGYNIGLSSPKEWNNVVNRILGEEFPYFPTIGNHEHLNWSRYVDLFQERLENLPYKTCVVYSKKKELGVKSYCHYKGIFFILSGVGIKGRGHESFIEKALSRYQSTTWKICAWHKNQSSMQLGGKYNEVGWKAYQICQKYGAVIATGHEHSYSRTKTLTQLGSDHLNHGAIGNPNELTLGPNKNFVFVSGVGGHSLRPYNCDKGNLAKWWASIFTTNYIVKNGTTIQEKDCSKTDIQYDQNNTEFGALFITFNYNGYPEKAYGEFITTEGRTLDNFIITKD